MSKRQKFIFSSLILAVALFFVQFVDTDARYLVISGLSGLAALLTLWSLREALAGWRWLTTLILPMLLTAAIGFFYFLLPSVWLTRLPVAIIYAVAMYALLLTENIFSVAAIRTIQLFRAASAVGFLLTLTTAFLLYDTVFSFRLSYWQNSLAVYVISLPLIFQALWSVDLDEKPSKPLILYSLLLPLVLAEMAMAISFYPLTITMSSLILTTGVYVLLGVIQAYFAQRLFRQTVYEYLIVGSAVLAIMLITTRWSG